MPANPDSLAVTDAYQARLLVLRRQAVAASAAAWQLDEGDLDGSHRRWIETTAETTQLGQAEGARTSDVYLAAYVTSETGRASPPQGLDVGRYVGVSRDGRPLTAALAASLFTVKIALAQRRGFLMASRMGLARALRIVAMEATEAPSRALDDAMRADRRIVGWRRVPTGNACGACLASATGAIQSTASVMPRHPHDRCVKEPVVRSAAEQRVRRPTGRQMFDQMSAAEQDALFVGRGGTAKADLIRSGKADLEDLLTVQPTAAGDDWITETPLADLVG